jgi:glyoxylase-like metal-dependent hydrolase (beta-lactamase superfamily II)
MRSRLTILSLLSVAWLGCAAPPIPARALAPSAPVATRGPVLRPCVMLHQRYTAPMSTAIDGGGEGRAPMIFASILVRHPGAGPIVIDPAVGRERLRDFAANPWLLRREIGDGSEARPLEELLRAAHVAPESVRYGLVTHAHFDHIAGATDIPAARIFMGEPEPRFADEAMTLWMKVTPQHEIDRIRDRVVPVRFDGPPHDGFPASFDLLGDGSIVAVPTPGHTPGSLSWLVSSAEGARWLFVGDAAWLRSGIDRPAHKGAMGRLLDDDVEEAGETLGLLHAYAKAHPEVRVLTGHDASMLDALPACAAP